MKILITGGCGFLGSNLAVAIPPNNELIVFDNLYRSGSTENLAWLREKRNCTFIHGDIRNREDVENVISREKPGLIYHLAGQVAMTTSIINPRMDFEINAVGSINVLEAVRKYSPASSILYSSTNKVYGDLEWVQYIEQPKRFVAPDYPQGFPETITLEFHSPYGNSKGCADQYMLDYHRIFGLKTVVFRHSSMYGSRQFSTVDQGWVGWFCQQAWAQKKGVAKGPFTIAGNGKQVRDVLYVDDLVALYLKAAKSLKTIKGQAFNIGGRMANSLSLLELFDILESELNVKLKYRKLPPRLSDQKVFVADISKIYRLLGWQPRVDKIAGIKKMISWIRKGR
ncbi:MAG: GDP-mannose 4,6-dehydratase [Elusimicrobia bacterium]|nr:GDP-mannose 4,6-dehydratase [Elusimicrobiota bacterium]